MTLLFSSCALAGAVLSAPAAADTRAVAGTLSGVDVASASDGWAVGSQRSTGPAGLSALIERWNGTAWRVAYAPDHDGVALAGVYDDSGSDAWAVGTRFNADNLNTAAVALHWDGTRWRPVPTVAGVRGGQFYGVAGASEGDVWAVGVTSSGSLAEHWTGGHWERVPTVDPVGSTGAALYAVTEVNPADVWAVGDYADPGQGTRLLVEHWNGHRWQIAPADVPPHVGTTELTGVSASANGRLWAVGLADTAGGSRPLIEHWNGHRWIVEHAAYPGGADFAQLYAVSVDISGVVWAVGTSATGPVLHSLVERFDGQAWRITPSQDQGGSAGYDIVQGVSARAGAPVAVGVYCTDGSVPDQRQFTDTLRWNGHRWVVT